MATIQDISPNKNNASLVNFALNGNSSNLILNQFAPDMTLIKDTILCQEQILQLEGNTASNYLWSTGENTPSIQISTTGSYWIQGNNGACSDRDTVSVQFAPYMSTTYNEDTICRNTSLNLSVYDPLVTSYLWDDQTILPHITVNSSGLYTVSRINACGESQASFNITVEDCPCTVFVPNTFTPNDDKHNPIFKAVYDCDLASFRLEIFNRWGESIYKSYHEDDGWDGTNKLGRIQDGVYSYRLKYSSVYEPEVKIQATGHISIIK